MKKNGITEYFEEVELTEEYNGCFYSIPEVITIAILRSICGLKNVSQIHQWAANDKVGEFLKEKPCYYWLLCLLKLDVYFEEDYCRVEDKNVQQNLNMLRKFSINLIKRYKERSASKRAISKIMFDCLLDPSSICDVVFEN